MALMLGVTHHNRTVSVIPVELRPTLKLSDGRQRATDITR
jgi:DNA-directed RNA polymerase beta' subunit